MTTNRSLDVIYYKRETNAIIPILNIYWQDISIVRLSHDLCVTHVSKSMEALTCLSKTDEVSKLTIKISFKFTEGIS